jgi:protein-tyrosine phosphatase
MRHIPLEGASNFRDFGGYGAADGRKVRMGQLYRSDRLAGLTQADFGALRDRGIRLVCDLRRQREIDMSPTVWGGSQAPEFLHVSLLTDASGPDVMSRVLADSDIRSNPVRSRQEMVKLYGRLAREPGAIAGYKTIFDRLATDDGYPFLVHCSAGKDRTGVVCALIHAVLGVSEDDILEDFMATRIHYDGAKNIHERATQIMSGLDVEGWTVEALAPVFTVEADYLRGFLDVMDEEHGTAVNFLTDTVGVRPEVLEAMRERLLEAA